MRRPFSRIDLKRFLSRPAVLVAAALALAGCSGLDALDALVPETGYRLIPDIAYGATPRMRFDLYLPEAGVRADVPPVLFFYGGSWRRGEKAGYRFIGQALASRGVAVAIADYRLFPAVRFPTFAADAARAASRLLEIAPAHGLPSRFVAMGHSAGAHTAAALMLDARYLAEAGVDPAMRAGLIALSGPVYIDPSRYDSTRPVFAPVADTEDAGRPVAHVSADDPPTYLIHGARDDTVYSLNSEKLATALEQAGVPVRFDLLDGHGHIAPLIALSHPFEDPADSLADRIADWIEALPRPRTATGS